MFLKGPKNSREIYWTRHIREKMRYYGLSEGRLRRIMRNPHRRERGIVPETVALMQTGQTKKPNEIWLMYQIKNKRKIMISAWRYPGISPKGKAIPIPENILDELKEYFDKRRKIS